MVLLLPPHPLMHPNPKVIHLLKAMVVPLKRNLACRPA
jgi:hypothetical protein